MKFLGFQIIALQILSRTKKMQKMITRSCSPEPWFVFLISFVLCFLLLSFDYSALFGSNNGVNFPLVKTETDSCSGRYIYIHNLPSRFNYDLINNCHSLTRGTEKDMCPYLENLGFGPKIENSEGVFSNMSWFKTNQFLLEVIFHYKMKKYKCLTNDSASASAIYVPFYAGLDISHYLWNPSISVRDSTAKDFLKWVSEKSEWKRMLGMDHFFVVGRISWDFRRQTDDISDWGSKLRFLPQSYNMTMLSVEASAWKNDFAIPYPTYFHPSKDCEVLLWQNRMRNQKRPNLFAFAGAPRPDLKDSIRGLVINQCQSSTRCKLIDCSSGKINCDNPFSVISVFQRSVFCLQPPGDSYTRRSIYDSILAGCIPVFFHPGTAYSQYLWHFPKNRTKYSVYIPVSNVTEWSGNIEEVLLGVSKDEEIGMREKIIRLIPRIVYADPRSESRSFEDAFDVTVKKILGRIEGVRKMIREGKDPSIGFADPDHYKYTFSNNV